MARHGIKLTAAFVRRIKTPGKYRDAHGLMLRVTLSGSKQWTQRIEFQGRRREFGLGGYPIVSLAEARETALDNRRLVRAGGDPSAARRPTVPTFQDATAKVIEIHRPNWKNSKHAAQWQTTLQQYAFPRLGRRRVDLVNTSDVMAVLLPIWNDKHETARRVRQRIGAVMQWAMAQGYRQDNPAGEAIIAALPKNGAIHRHQKALRHTEVGGAIAAVHQSGATQAVKLAFEFLVLTACRSGEVRLARWEEVDLAARVWTIPAERMKAKREHRVPLSARSLQILSEARAVTGTSGLVFPSPTGRELSDSTLSKLLRELEVQAVPHGFRSSFRDWAAECTDAPHAVMEAALAHTIRNRVEAAYARSDLFGRRQDLMQQWADYLASSH